MKNKKKFTVAIVSILFILSLISFKIFNDIQHPFNTKTGVIPVFVHKGDTLFNVLDKLRNEGFIKNEYLIKFYIKHKELNTNIKPGEYSVPKDITTIEFVETLNKGLSNNYFIRVTIPEGSDIEGIASKLDESGIISKNDFIKSCIEYKVPSFISTREKVRYTLEGYLFPDTYQFERGTDGEKIINVMLNRFEEIIGEIEKEEGKKIKNLEELITIASIVEKEARVEEDRAKIASVFFNRLEKGIMLQTDATVLYALGEHRDRLYLKDLKVESPYNTYKVKGLPPGPISSPGKACIKAALNPQKTDYIYYVLQDKKKHYFTNNYQDFLKAKSEYKKNYE